MDPDALTEQSTAKELQNVRLPDTTRATLVQFRRRVRQIKIAEGIFAGLFGLAVSWMFVFIADRFVDTSAVVRIAALIVGTLGFALYFPLKCHKWVWGTRTMRQVAALLRHKFPALGDQVLGVVELASGEQTLGESRVLAAAAIEQVDKAVRDHDFHDAVPRPRHCHWGLAAGIPVALLLLALAVVPEAGWNAVARWLTPWRDVDRYTFAQIEPLPEQIVVPHGEEFSLKAQLRDSTKWSPDRGKVLISGQQNVASERTENAYGFDIPPQTKDAELAVRIGDIRESVDVKPMVRPELTSMTASVKLPGYLQYSKDLHQDVRGGVVSLVQGAVVEFVAEVSRSLKAASLDGGAAGVDGAVIRTAPREVTASSTLKFEWTDELGLSSREPFPLSVKAVEDAEPAVSCVQEDPLLVVLSTDTITFNVNADDDYGVQKIGLEWSGIEHPQYNPHPETGDKTVAPGAPEERSVSARATFCAESDNVRPQSIKVRAWAEDYKPDRGRVYSPAFVLHVLTPEDHALWVAEQLRRWASRADDVYEQEMRLHDGNRELRRMDSDDLHTKDTQRRIQQHSTAERANAERLSQLTNQGDKLIDQAMRNPEMMVGHLETFAQALQNLKKIAANRMPSVADLLEDAAKEASKNTKMNPGSTEPGEKSPFAGNNRSKPDGEPKPASRKKKSGKVPVLGDAESGFNPKDPNKTDEEAKPDDKPPGKGKFGLPVTTLQGGPQPKKQKQPDDAAKKVDEAVEEQAELLAEFEKVREELQKIMDDLENSTFVKRLKAASRRQQEVATDLNRTLFKGFGRSAADLDKPQQEQSERIATREEKESELVWLIKSDMEAYYGRRKEEKFRRIAEEMTELDAISKIGKLGVRVRRNQNGDAISRVEFWADTLDRWGEELVSPSRCGGCKGGKGESLPPSIVLEIMRILEGEIDLREETRGLETAQAAIEKQKYEASAERLYVTQTSLEERTEAVLEDIRAIPDGAEKFAKELQIIGAAAAAMGDAADILKQPSTGPDAIAAETEAIELLLQSKRVNPKGGGGGGGSSPGGGSGGDTETVALALHGPGSDPNAHIEGRDIRQATGTAGEKLPEEFRDGLEAFFNAVENAN